MDGPTMAGASVESCRFVVLRSPRGRLGSELDMGSRLRRMRGRFDQWIQIKTGPQQCADHFYDPPKFSIQSSLESPKNRRMRSRRLPDPRPIREGVREPICIRKKCAIWPRWRPVPVKNVNYPRPPRNRNSGLVGPHTTPPIVNYKYMSSTRREGYFCAAHARGVNILIWTSRKSVGHGTNDRVMVHGDGTRADGRRFRSEAQISEMSQPQDQRGAGAFGNRKSNVVHAQAGYLARPVTEAPETRIYFTTHRSGANSVPRVRTVVRGERASRSIVNRTTGLWSIWVVASLILAGLGFGPIFA